MIQTAWSSQRLIKEVMVFLQSHGVSTTYAVKIYKQYKNEAIAIVTENPYQLATDIYGIGFVTADTIARNMGVSPDSEFRYRAGTIHVLGEAAEDNGHCFLPRAELIEQVGQRLALPEHTPDPQVVTDIVWQMGLEDKIVIQGHREHGFICYQPSFFMSEQNLTSRLAALLSRPLTVDSARVSAWIDGRGGGDKGTRGQGERAIFSPDKWFQAPDNSSGKGEKFVSRHKSASHKMSVFQAHR